uniref:JunD proto-oncogene, AP-1 transcription factor subunit n=1 Tax=Bos mutus grunniens TaxID=30521 RepID=A0A8B9Z241_BOSMU
MQMRDVTRAQWRAGTVSSSRRAEAIRGRTGCAAQEPPPAEGRAQRPQPGRVQGRADGGGRGPPGGRGHSPPGPARRGRRRMETPFYGDEALSGLGGGGSSSGGGGSFASPGRSAPGAPTAAPGSMMKKDALTLSLSEQVAAALKPAAAPPPGPLRTDGAPGTAPPDGLLASPELERLIIQSNGLVTTTPTSTQFLYPKVAASEEQEFAEGFVKALEDLHKQNQLGAGAASAAAAAGGPSGTAAGAAPPSELAPAAATPEAPVYANLSSYAGGTGSAGDAATVAFAAEPVPFPPPPPPGTLGPPRLAALKDEPQTVPDVPSFGESPPLSPIDMDTQERIKAERKLERISRLEEKVKTLKSQNTELASTASLLREQVAQLKQKVLSHVNSGCQLLPQHQEDVSGEGPGERRGLITELGVSTQRGPSRTMPGGQSLTLQETWVPA